MHNIQCYDNIFIIHGETSEYGSNRLSDMIKETLINPFVKLATS